MYTPTRFHQFFFPNFSDLLCRGSEGLSICTFNRPRDGIPQKRHKTKSCVCSGFEENALRPSSVNSILISSPWGFPVLLIVM